MLDGRWRTHGAHGLRGGDRVAASVDGRDGVVGRVVGGHASAGRAGRSVAVVHLKVARARDGGRAREEGHLEGTLGRVAECVRCRVNDRGGAGAERVTRRVRRGRGDGAAVDKRGAGPEELVRGRATERLVRRTIGILRRLSVRNHDVEGAGVAGGLAVNVELVRDNRRARREGTTAGRPGSALGVASRARARRGAGRRRVGHGCRATRISGRRGGALVARAVDRLHAERRQDRERGTSAGDRAEGRIRGLCGALRDAIRGALRESARREYLYLPRIDAGGRVAAAVGAARTATKVRRLCPANRLEEVVGDNHRWPPRFGATRGNCGRG
mmetsp:Transcript_19750/g.75721  ORF Transcript_19750/g.75721 Transcript_19750/m.75721 type:complete len:329 (-) Transcript_19750:176-1162(-)